MTPTQVFPYEICESFKNTRFEEHLQTTASIYYMVCLTVQLSHHIPGLQLMVHLVRRGTNFGFHLSRYLRDRSSRSEVFLVKGVLEMCSEFKGEQPCRSCFATLLKSHFGMGVLP